MLRSLHTCRSSIGLRTVGLLIVLGGLLCAVPTLRDVSAQATAPAAESNPQPAVAAQTVPEDEKADVADEPKTYDGKDFNWWRRDLRTELKPELRVEALRAMGHFGANGYAEQATASIIEAVASYGISELDRDTKSIRDAGSTALRRIGPSAADALIAVLSEENGNARRFAVSVLVNLTPDADVVRALVTATRDNDREVRLCAVSGLTRDGIDGEVAIPALTAALNDKDTVVRYCAASALGGFESRAGDAVPALIAAAKDDQPFVRQNALSALARIRPNPVLVVPTFTEALEDEEQSVRQEATQGLSSIGPEAKSAVPALIDEYSRVSAGDRAAIIEALGEIGPDAKQALPLITRVLQDKDEGMRRIASAALKKITE